MDKLYYYKYFQFERQHWWFKARQEILESYIAENIGSGVELKILNVGAATGATSEMLMKFGNLTSIEFNRDCIDFANEKLNLSHGKRNRRVLSEVKNTIQTVKGKRVPFSRLQLLDRDSSYSQNEVSSPERQRWNSFMS